MRALPREHIVLVICALLVGGTLLGINSTWPSTFTVVIAIAGVVGAFVVLYEVRLTKHIAQAEFIRDLQSGFTSDPSICEIWGKLLRQEEITELDRPKVSNYLTFFETLELLIAKGTLEMPLIDDLFRNRFFTAIGDKGIQSTALIRQKGAFSNIHDLIALWHDYLLERRIPVHDGYYSYIQAITEAKGYEVSALNVDHLEAFKGLQEEVMNSLKGKKWLRANTEEMLQACLKEQTTWGVQKDGRLVAVAVLFDGQGMGEDLRTYLPGNADDHLESVNLKLVLTSPSHRKKGLGRTLVELLEREASVQKKTQVLCTIHPENSPSRRLFKLLGYRRVKRAVKTTYGSRDVFARTLPTLNKRWAR